MNTSDASDSRDVTVDDAVAAVSAGSADDEESVRLLKTKQNQCDFTTQTTQ